MSIYDYKPDDIIKAYDILEEMRKKYTMSLSKELQKDTLELIKLKNIERDIINCQNLLNIELERVEEFQILLKTRDDILNTLINDYHIHKYFDTSSENEPCTLNFVFENENYTLKIDKNYITFFDTYKSEKILITESIRIFTEGDFIDKQEKAIKKIADILLKPVC
ncbi:hypothetical protein [Brachyspira aalborgi]|jgi:hypothetical protein|uniref:Uncharacterized protein n=1 Tax=Brachyspira aalborgi TaxID=29522 RepID=A0ABY3K6N4_9SPIR|nr:hypothetical protein [Brachyspira aalborgi]TXJ31187.1 hypothetical protein EPJ71_10660 [Brachyspira aalborgi]TXJ40077.1 hypothetical protein EPJ65_12600 [Brachyspira aalborgi]DAZ18896.1 MAG TPA: hypothetical protein [Caudoviricetes sp.]